MEMTGQRHALAALPPGKEPSTNNTGGSVRPRASLDGCGTEKPLSRTENRAPDLQERNESLY
jgi:hypothetical protein